MGWIQRHVVAVAAVAIALSATAGVFLFARPAYHPPRPKVVDMAEQDHYTVPQVRRAFASEGLQLRYVWHLQGMTFLATQRRGASTFLITIFDPTKTVDFGTYRNPDVLVDQLVGNAQIFYGGHDKRLAARIESGADALAH